MKHKSSGLSVQQPALPSPLDRAMRTAGLLSAGTQNPPITHTPPAKDMEVEKLLLRSEVLELTRMSRGTLDNKIRDGEFCRPIKIGLRSIRFLESEVREWIQDRIAVRDLQNQKAPRSGDCATAPIRPSNTPADPSRNATTTHSPTPLAFESGSCGPRP